MLQLARGVERIGVDRHQPRLQDAEKRNRVLQQVGQHNRHALAARQLQDVLQIGSEIFRQLADFGVSERFAHVLKRGLMREFFNALTEYVADRTILRDVDFGIDALFIAVEPEFFHINQSCFVGFMVVLRSLKRREQTCRSSFQTTFCVF